jgi:hypothetical protein
MAGYANPIPTRDSAKLILRMPSALHRRVQMTAAENGVSINTWLNVLIAGGLGFELEPDNSAATKVCTHCNREMSS